MILEKIFFSYSRADAADFALRLALDLKKQGFNVWLDQEDIRAGLDWDIEIEKALETCDCVLFIETEKSVSSNNVLDEVYYALEQHKKVIPLILVDSKMPFRLQRLQHIDFTKNYNSGLSLLVNELKGNTVTEPFPPEDVKPLPKVDKPFFTKYKGPLLIIILLIIIIAGVIIYTGKNKGIGNVNEKQVTITDTTTGDRKLVDIDPNITSKKEDDGIEGTDEKKVTDENRNKKVSKTGDEIVNKPNNGIGNLPESFTGKWKLADVEPKAESSNGYLNIEGIDEKKVTIKSYVQFYYFKTNDTSFLSIFNAFAGCSSCILEKEMKITAEDIAIGSQFYKISKGSQSHGGKNNDTVLTAGANKSIHASVTLSLINNKTAVIKVQQRNATELTHGLVLEPFVYSFRFTKTDD